jgi:YfiH family protein
MSVFPDNVKYLSTSRIVEGGSSAGNYHNFNLALHVGDEESSVHANRKLLLERCSPPSEPRWIKQTHSNICHRAENSNVVVEADASYTNQRGVVCAVLTADCLPVFVSDKQGSVVGVAHAGWRGIAGGVIESLLKATNVNGKDLAAHLGPAISVSAYQVGAEVRDQYIDKNRSFASCFAVGTEKIYLDLYKAAKVVLAESGVVSVSGGGYCTYRDGKEFFSYRRDGKKSGRMANLIWME